jgi:hypothetical protein
MTKLMDRQAGRLMNIMDHMNGVLSSFEYCLPGPNIAFLAAFSSLVTSLHIHPYSTRHPASISISMVHNSGNNAVVVKEVMKI